MSYLTPGKLEVGYSLTRKRRQRGYRREELTRFGRIPSHKATLLWLVARYAFVEKSILVVTEGFGQQLFHGRIVLLVNEHTASAGEMVTATAYIHLQNPEREVDCRVDGSQIGSPGSVIGEQKANMLRCSSWFCEHAPSQ